MATTTDDDVTAIPGESASAEVSHETERSEGTYEQEMAKSDNDAYKESISETLQNFCEKKKWSIVDLQNACGLPYPTAYAYYHGMMVPTLTNFAKLKKVLKADFQPFLNVMDEKAHPAPAAPSPIKSKRRKTPQAKR
jgi:hypothetical protein